MRTLFGPHGPPGPRPEEVLDCPSPRPESVVEVPVTPDEPRLLSKEVPSSSSQGRTPSKASSAWTVSGATHCLQERYFSLAASITSSAPPTPQDVMKSQFSDVSMCRATSVSTLMMGFGTILENSEGTDATYNMSRPVQRMHWFISHNWATPRWRKFAVLAFQFNFKPAMALTLLSFALICSLTAAGILPTVDSESNFGTDIGVAAQIIGPWFFLLVLFTWHEVGSRIGLNWTRVFFDKTCIHQSDDERKNQGILGLAAFLESTDGMLVVYTDTYLQRLWTVFELASLIILHPHKKLVVVPTFAPWFVVLGCMTMYVGYICYMVAFLDDDNLMYVYVAWAIIICGGLAVSFGLRQSARREETIHRSVAEFSLAKADCFRETDRRRVFKTVDHFMKKAAHLEWDAPQEVALKAFDTLVHEKVPRALVQTFGYTGLPYQHLVTIFISQQARLVDALGGYFASGKEVDPRLVFTQTVEYLAVGFAIIPAFVAINSLCMRRCMKLRGILEAIFVLVAGLLNTSAGLAAWIFLAGVDTTNAAGLTKFLAVVVFFSTLTAYLYFPLGPDGESNFKLRGFLSFLARALPPSRQAKSAAAPPEITITSV